MSVARPRLAAPFAHLVAAARAHRFLRFLIVGAVNTLFGYGAYLFFLLLSGHSGIALTVSTIVGVTFNFFSTGRLVFNSRDRRRILRFAGVYLFLYLVNLIALRALETQGLGPALAQALLILPCALLAYLLQREFVFSSPRASA